MKLKTNSIIITLILIAGSCETTPDKKLDSEQLLKFLGTEKFLLDPRPHSAYGTPKYEKDDPKHNKLLEYRSFSVYYDDKILSPRWAAYKITNKMIGKNSDFKRPGKFKADEDIIEKGFNYTIHDDYNNLPGATYENKWNRGHMVPFAEIRGWGEKDGEDSMFTSNVCPQKAPFNGGVWKALEGRMGKIAKKHGYVWIIVGPIYDKPKKPFLPGRKIPKPDAFFRIAFHISKSGDINTNAFVLKHKKLSYESKFIRYKKTIDDIEKITKIDFFHKLDDEIEDKIESSKGTLWFD